MVAPRLRIQLVAAVQLGGCDPHPVAEAQDPLVALVAGTGLEQADAANVGVGEPPGDHRSCGAATDNHVVKLRHEI